MTQAQFNRKLSYLLRSQAANIVKSIDLNNTKDPYASDTKTNDIFMSNIISALSGYDVSSNLLTEEQILYTFELGICAGQSYSL